MSERLASLRRTVRSHRMVIAPLLVGLATLIAVWTVIPQTSGKPVVVAATNLAAGTEITSADLDVRTFPPALIPEGAHSSIDAVVGSHASGSLSAGAPVTDDSLLEKITAPDGTVLVPVTAADPASASIIQAGSRVRVYSAQAENRGGLGDPGGTGESEGAGGAGAKVLTRSGAAVVQAAVVTGISRPASSALGDDKLVFTLAVTPDEAAELATIPPDMLSFAIVQ